MNKDPRVRERVLDILESQINHPENTWCDYDTEDQKLIEEVLKELKAVRDNYKMKKKYHDKLDEKHGVGG